MKTIKSLLILSSMLLVHNVQAQFSCNTAVAITSGYTSSTINTPGNSGAEDWVTSASATCGSASNSAFTSSDVYLFKYTTGAASGESFYFTIEHDYTLDDEHAIGVWTDCSGTSLNSCVTSTYKFDNVVGVCCQNLPANTTYYIGIGKQWGTKHLKFNVIDFTVENSTTIPSNECATASAINITDPYNGSTRCNYSASAGSPSACGMSIENDSWMKFTAASPTVVIDYSVSNCTNDYGVQLSVFSGTCASMSLLTGSCVNYASNNSTGTWTFTNLTVGNTYYIRTDGYAGDLCSYAFSPVSGVVILPIELSAFNGLALENGYNRLTWSTESEQNSAFFILEKSTNGTTFSEMAKLPAAGNSSHRTNYYLLDKGDLSSLSYYRLKLIDQNGAFFYSDIISLENSLTGAANIYPNPSEDGLFNLDINSTRGYSQLEVFDLQGRMLFSQMLNDEKQLKLDLSAFGSGIYHVNLRSEHENFSQKITIR